MNEDNRPEAPALDLDEWRRIMPFPETWAEREAAIERIADRLQARLETVYLFPGLPVPHRRTRR